MFINPNDFERVVREMRERDERLLKEKLYKVKFAIEPYWQHKDTGSVTAYVGWTDGRTWNGWAMPYFEKDWADRYTHNFRANCADMGVDDWAQYNERTDEYCFYFADNGNYGDDDAWDCFGSVERDGMTLYPIGSGCWVWDIIARWDEEKGEWVDEDQFGNKIEWKEE